MKRYLILVLVIKIVIAVPVILEVKDKTIVVNGQKAKVATIEQPSGVWGYWGQANESFDVIVRNRLSESTMIHWHGMILPNEQDGVAGLTNPDIPPGGEYHFRFPLLQSGSYWMHSHDGLQLQNMVVAPLIIEDAEDSEYQQVVVMFQDYTKQAAHNVLNKLRAVKSSDTHAMHGQMDMPGMLMDDMPMDLNDVKYDAYLTNYHENRNPQVTLVKPSSQVKLRFINSASSSNFWVNLGKLNGKLIAVDGTPVRVITGNKFQLAMGQRLDVVIDIPKSGGDFPIVGQVEGLKTQTGLILTTNRKPKLNKIINNAKQPAPALDYSQELILHSISQPDLSRPAKLYKFKLSGDMEKYIWQINDQTWPKITPLQILHGQTVQFEFDNETMMSHPMHLHGYNFKIIAIDGKAVDGAIRDTILVTPHSKVTVEFVANHDGKWMLHCHTLYHMHAGMMTYIIVKSDK